MTRPPRSPTVVQKKSAANSAFAATTNGAAAAAADAAASELAKLVERPQSTFRGGGSFVVGVQNGRMSHSRNSSLSSLDSGYCSTVSDSNEYDGANYFNDVSEERRMEFHQADEYLEPTKLPPNSSWGVGRKGGKLSDGGCWWRLSGWARRVPRADPAALQFALRMALLLTVSGLFVLVQTPHGSWPDGMWVLVSVLFVCWFPSLDAASVVEKIFQRLIGTFFGAVLGLSCGFISLYLFHSRPYQASFLGGCMLVFNFLIVFLAGQCKVGGVKVIRKYAYATILCVLTFCICMLPFGCNNNPKWMKGVMRVVNVTIGCLLGAIGAIVVSPKSTAAVLHDKTARQVKLCGEAAEAVLAMAADHFAGNVVVQGLAEELVSAPLETTVRWSLRRVNSGNLSEPSITKSKNADVALQKFEDAMEDWKASKMLFPLTRFDPFHLRFDEKSYAAKASLNKAIARTLARSMRIQTTVVMIDGMVRHDTEYNLDRRDLRLLRRIGSLILTVLTVPLDVTASNDAAQKLLDELDSVRVRISVLSHAVAQHDDFDRAQMELRFRESLGGWDCSSEINDDVGRGLPLFASDANQNARFFLQLVEHLILRTVSLYQAWKQVQVQVANVTDGTVQSWLLQVDEEMPSIIAVPKAGDSLRSLIGM